MYGNVRVDMFIFYEKYNIFSNKISNLVITITKQLKYIMKINMKMDEKS
jgi:hypothetical protein